MDEEASEDAESPEGTSDLNHTPRNSRSQAGLSETGPISALKSLFCLTRPLHHYISLPGLQNLSPELDQKILCFAGDDTSVRKASSSMRVELGRGRTQSSEGMAPGQDSVWQDRDAAGITVGTLHLLSQWLMQAPQQCRYAPCSACRSACLLQHAAQSQGVTALSQDLAGLMGFS